MRKVLCVLFVLLFCAWATVRIVAWITFDRNCEGYLKRAADANTVELAKKQLEFALSYMEREQLTSGYTSVFYRTPDEDVGFWYTNLKESLAELKKMDPNASQLERSNLLMKLRETLLDQGQRTQVTVPDGISVYPNNIAMATFGLLSALFSLLVGAITIEW